ncbi:exported hypothetical protein [groundwater metagenome]|uniref:Uncharacterized protein n=1 Tax=groundwater metagenome TaxID=717931 RepID=A0A098EBZ6_9ZZZZ
MKHKNGLAIGLIISAVLLLIVGYTLLSGVNQDSPFIPTNSSVENSTIYFLEDNGGVINGTELLDRLNLSFDEIPHNTNPTFKIGNKFEYVAHNPKIGGAGHDHTTQSIQKITYSVVEKEKSSGIECYVIESVNLFLTNEFDPSSSGRVSRQIYYISTETGRIIRFTSSEASIKNGVEMNKKDYFADVPSEISEVYNSIIAYSPWMLSLDDEFEMEIKRFVEGKIEKEVITVVGRDKIKNRECYIVELRNIGENNDVISRETKWIDTQKRILIKSEVYYGNLKINSIELVSELK